MLKWLCALLLAIAALPAFAAPPNVVYVLADDLGVGDVSAYNAHSKIQTPHIDSLAKAGLLFTDAHSGSAVCTPTRYGILTGRYAWRTRLTKGVLHGYDEPLIEPGRLTVASMLKQKGYATACVGKWHLGLGWAPHEDAKKASKSNPDFTRPLTAGPHTAGFDYSYIIPASLDMDPYVYAEDGRVVAPPTAKIPDSPRPAFYRGGWASPGFSHETCLAELTASAQAWVDARATEKDKPFFLYLALPSPHTPHVPRAAFKGKSAAGVYGDFVVETDWAVGQILAALKRHGLEENTLVIVTSDNGSHTQPLELEKAFGHPGNGPWRGQKSDAWEGGHRVPFVARWPAVIAARAQTDQTICTTDLMATLAAIVDVKLPNDAAEDSVDLSSVLRGKANGPAREATVHHGIDGTFAIRQGGWKLILAKGSGGWSLPEGRAGRDAPRVQLYNLNDDPGERRNVQAEHADVVERLTALLDRYRREGRSVPRR